MTTRAARQTYVILTPSVREEDPGRRYTGTNGKTEFYRGKGETDDIDEARRLQNDFGYQVMVDDQPVTLPPAEADPDDDIQRARRGDDGRVAPFYPRRDDLPPGADERLAIPKPHAARPGSWESRRVTQPGENTEEQPSG